MTKAAELAKMGEVLTNSQIGGRRNLFYNPKMSVSQRATSVTGKTGGGYLVCDRYYVTIYNAGTWSLSQSTDVPTGEGFSNSFKFDCTTADASLASTDDVAFEQRFEGQDLQQLKKGTSNAETTILSFYVKSNKTGTYNINLIDNDNSLRMIAKSYTINSANTWERKEILIEGDTTGALGNDNGFSLLVQWKLATGSAQTSGSLQTSWGTYDATKRAEGQVNLADSTSNEWYITGIQWELGTATPFEHRSVAEELALCQRYLYRISGSLYEFFVNGVRNNTNYLWCPLQLPVPLRTQPTITTSGTSNNCFGIWLGTGGSWDTQHTTMGVYANPDLHDGSVVQLALALNGISTSFGDGQCVNLAFQDNGFLNCDAEL